MNSEEMPLVTVITACYRQLDYLVQTIGSVLSQDYEAIEYIITDDGTEDFPEEYYKRYIDTNKRKNILNYQILNHNKNQGTVKNLNSAIKIASGKYIIFCDGDDIFATNNIITQIVISMEEKQANILLTKRVICDEALTPVREIPNNREERKINSMNTAQKQYHAHLKNHIYGVASSSVLSVNSQMFKKYGLYDEKYLLLEDAPFFAKILKDNIKIETDFSITSIYYRDGGISNIPFVETDTNKKYLEDNLLYMKNEAKYAQNILNWFERYLYNSYLEFFLVINPTKWVHFKYLGAIGYYRVLGYLSRVQNKNR